jgi:ribosomal protein S18 acetylase RimI-like enzyme
VPQIIADHNQSQNDGDAVTAFLMQHSDAASQPWNPVPYAFTLMYGDRICGGLMGNVNRGWAYVAVLAVDEKLRGQGWGEKLMSQAEAWAMENNCAGIWLDTFSFQAPKFYKKLGFTEFGRLPNFPDDQIRHFFKKELDQAS